MIHPSSYFNIQNLFYLKEFLQASPSTLNAQKITKMTSNNGNFVGISFTENIKRNSEVMEVQIRTLKKK